MDRREKRKSRRLRPSIASCLCLRPKDAWTYQVETLSFGPPGAAPGTYSDLPAGGARVSGPPLNRSKHREGHRRKFITWRAKVWPLDTTSDSQTDQPDKTSATADWLQGLQQTPLPRDSLPQLERHHHSPCVMHNESGSDAFEMASTASDQDQHSSISSPRHERAWSIASAGTDAHRRALSLSTLLVDSLLNKIPSLEPPSILSKQPSLATLQPSSSLGLDSSLGRPPSLGKPASPPHLPRSTRISHYRALSGPWYEVQLD